ncbi:unnamed protein product [Bursaphelenchus xylophilus]|uniref:(pine wood nematode) hypothetical protein n=1 Tax=Bursaphelenchus xylophilus TaxID=6326 RepID=A0A1I7RSI3_BURXY|nr:unnamed protein product [Bursaphelenchus xylophilus]CAG9122924.1 unnamed protein product [Bursaphelenchus xylophilus]
MSAKSNQQLPPKEMALFRKTVRSYEQKQYKQALRCTKQILANPHFSEHGETLCMRGLILNCIGKHEEAMDIVKRGLKADLKSYVCWHVYGQVHRSDKQYEMAMKAYKRALSLDSENLQILRDLGLLQIQMRDYIGYRDTRYQLLVVRPQNKAHWVGYANACQMMGDHDTALRVINDVFKTLKNNESERGDLTLYKVSLLVESKKLNDALNVLEENAAIIPDKLTYLETRADLLFKVGKIADSQKAYEWLLKRNPDNVDYMKRIEECIRLLDNENAEKVIKEFYEEQIKANPRTRILKIRLLLHIRNSEDFRDEFVKFLVSGLRSGLPSLFTCLSAFYEDPSKMAFVETFLVDFVRKSNEFGYEKASLDGSPHPELPITIVWVWYYLAQQVLLQKRYDDALGFIKNAINHTPTLVDLYTLKAKILKKKGDLAAAAVEMEDAQSMDTADRYLNCLATKYFLKTGRMSDAAKMCEKFTREGMKSEDALQEMQCLWYPWAAAKAHRAKGELGEALKRCHQIERIITSFYEEQYDFHTYCVRKCFMTPYVSMLHYLDRIHSNPFYVKAAKLAAEIYLDLAEHPNGIPDKKDELELQNPDLSPSELKKLRRKQNKQKAQEEEKLAKEQQNNKDKNQKRKPLDGEADVVDGSPLDPKKLVATNTPLDEAAKLIHPIILSGTDSPSFYATAFRLYQLKDKPLLMLKSLKALSKLGDKDSIDKLTKEMENYVKAKSENLDGPVKTTIDEILLQIKGQSVNHRMKTLELNGTSR